MARRRYLSTDISTDTRVNKLAMNGGDFAALLYTWMIPHASDAALLPGDPEELLLIVCPGRRDKEPEDIANAVDAMVDLGLIERSDGDLAFPSSFYSHQTYITAQRRTAAQGSPTPEPINDPDEGQRTSAQNSADQRTSKKVAENAAYAGVPVRARPQFSSSVSSSSKSSLSVSSEGEGKQAGADAPNPAPPETKPTPKPKATRIPDPFVVTDEMREWAAEKRMPPDLVDYETERFEHYYRAEPGLKGTKLDWPATWKNWLLRDFGKPNVTPIRRPPNGYQKDIGYTTDELIAMAREEKP